MPLRIKNYPKMNLIETVILPFGTNGRQYVTEYDKTPTDFVANLLGQIICLVRSKICLGPSRTPVPTGKNINFLMGRSLLWVVFWSGLWGSVSPLDASRLPADLKAQLGFRHLGCHSTQPLLPLGKKNPICRILLPRTVTHRFWGLGHGHLWGGHYSANRTL